VLYNVCLENFLLWANCMFVGNQYGMLYLVKITCVSDSYETLGDGIISTIEFIYIYIYDCIGL